MVALTGQGASSARAAAGRRAALVAAIIILLTIETPPVDDAVHHAFSAHMAQHAVLMNVAAPLLAIGWPLALGRWRSSWVVAALNLLARPAPALILSTAALWSWHIPAFYDVALESDALHALEHAVFLGGFVLFWRPLIDDPRNPGFLNTNGGRVFYLTLGMIATSLLAAYISFADHLIYSFYTEPPPGGRSLLADQHLGGAIMWLSGVVTMVAAALLTLRDEPDAGG